MLERANRIRGAILGAAIGDALGAPFEFQTAGDAAWKLGGDRITEFRAPGRKPEAHGLWDEDAPAGTGTDDTRYLWLFCRLAAEVGRLPTATELAQGYLQVYATPEEFFPAAPESAKEQFRLWEPVCRGCLGERSEVYPEVPPEVLRERSVGLNLPSLIGLITLAPAGLLFPGEPEAAYQAAWLTDFYDVGYAREATAMLAASLARACGGESRPRRVLYEIEELDPYQLGGPFGRPTVTDRLLGICNGCETKGPESVIARELCFTLRGFHPFDPLRALVTAWVAALAADGNVLRAIRIAVNQRGVEGRDKLTGYLDIDSYALVAGALAGALCGPESLPEDMVEQVIESNRKVNGIDLEEAIAALTRTVPPEE